MSQEPETLLPLATKNEKIWHQSYTEGKKNSRNHYLYAENLKWHFLKA